MKKWIFLLLFAFLFFGLISIFWQWKEKSRPSDLWIKDFHDSFKGEELSQEWHIPIHTKKVSKMVLTEKSLFLENQQYSPYTELWLEKRYEGPVRIEFDLKLQLKRAGEFGVRIAHAQTEILPNTPGYEAYLLSFASAIIKRADRDEQTSATVSFPAEVTQGQKWVKFAVEKDHRKVQLWIEDKLVLEFPDPELLSGKKFARLGLFLIAGRASIKNLQISVFPKEESDLLEGAYEFYNEGQYAQSLNLLEKFLKEKPDHKRSLEARLRRALCYKHLENYGESVAALTALQFNVVDKEYVPDAIFFLGEIYQKLKQYQNAIKYYSGFNERFPKHPYVPKAYERLAICQWSMNDYEQALQTTAELQRKFPGTITAIHAHYFRGQIYEKLNEKEKAIVEYQTLLSLVQKDLVANLTRRALRKLVAEKSGKGVLTTFKKDRLEILYPNDPARILRNAPKLTLHWGRNGWREVQDSMMEKTEKGWFVSIPLTKEFRSIEFVFTDGQGNWDNNEGLNWELEVPHK